MRVAVVLPAYNEAATVADLASRAWRQAGHVIVVDDGSHDGTPEKLAGLPVTVLRHVQNRGKAASLWSGANHAVAMGADVVITLDADGQHFPEDIPRFIETAKRYPGRIILGVRRRGRASMPRARRFGNWMADFWISWAAGYKIHDSQSGFRLYPSALFQGVKVPHDRRNGFVYESEILIEAARNGVYSVPIAIEAVYPAHARRSHYRPFLDTWRVVRMVAWKLASRGFYPRGLIESIRSRDSGIYN